ncbi:Auxin-induced in root cultures protein 12 precursor, putative [Ricinus communis]|uniref:Cytochrome b561 and DOMON domain-containing protein n=1 Tax=Ricinus communis TaxID=3988 RepID=B9T181_RICCO|nr:Auxin-induced in root cultures protein 12 precursor, putative [Ricinus communis]|eukprot:XP_002532004.1 cytochrome b561 and DOMON domain-containing protein At5g35735 [Ricinus communis]
MGKSLRAALFSCVLLMCLSVPSLAQTCGTFTFSSNQIYATCSDLPQLDSFLHWNYHPSNMTADIAFRRTGTTTSNWVVWALNPTGQQMQGSQALLAFHDSTGTPTAYTTSIDTMSPTMQRGNLSFGVQNIRAEYSNNEMIIFATLQLNANLISTNQVWQVGTMTGTTFNSHAMDPANRASVGTINFATGTTVAGSAPSNSKKNVHGVLNAVSWGILMPMGIMIARYVKVFKVANPAWFYLHVACQSSAYVVGVAGWGTGLKLGSDSPGIKYEKHRNIGITLFCLATLQIFAMLLRPKPDHKYRLYWNIYHHSIGYATIILSIINVYEGLDILDPEKKWKRAYSGVLIFLGATAAVLEAVTWLIVIRRKKTVSSDKYTNGTNGYGA